MQSFTAYRYASNISWIYIFGRLYCTCIYTYNIVSNLVLKYNRYTENAQVGSLPSILTCLGSIFGMIVILSGVRFSSINREFPLNTSSTEATNIGGSRISQIGGKNLLFSKIFAENCMKIKECWLRGRVTRAPPLDPQMTKYFFEKKTPVWLGRGDIHVNSPSVSELCSMDSNPWAPR